MSNDKYPSVRSVESGLTKADKAEIDKLNDLSGNDEVMDEMTRQAEEEGFMDPEEADYLVNFCTECCDPDCDTNCE